MIKAREFLRQKKNQQTINSQQKKMKEERKKKKKKKKGNQKKKGKRVPQGSLHTAFTHVRSRAPRAKNFKPLTLTLATLSSTRPTSRLPLQETHGLLDLCFSFSVPLFFLFSFLFFFNFLLLFRLLIR
eukprot:m.134817 g.134817  ORF g.134817 m.134817 type:complete len:128 (+) comp23886_c1_seq4:188-571(+)